MGILILTVVSFLFAAGAYFLYRAFQASVDKRTLNYQSDLLEKHCQEVQNMYTQTRGWRHDYHSHIQTMKAHLAMGNLTALEAYLNELDKDLTSVDTVIKTGNVMIDAVLNSKISLAKARGIAVEAKAMVPENHAPFVSEVDLCLIIGNLMDNSMEACMKTRASENRFIRIYIDILKSQLYIYIMNGMEERPRRQGLRYLSTKDSKSHGFGLMRVDKVVERYHGYLDRQDEDGVFVTEIMLPLQSA